MTKSNSASMAWKLTAPAGTRSGLSSTYSPKRRPEKGASTPKRACTCALVAPIL